MKNFVQFQFFKNPISGSTSQKIHEDAYQKFITRWPEFRTGGEGINVKLEINSPELPQVLDFLEHIAEKRPHWNRFPYVSHDYHLFQVFATRTFDRQDIENAEWSYCSPRNEIAGSAMRLNNGILQIRRKTIKSQPIGNTYGGKTVVCTNQMRLYLEAQKFKKLSFLPVAVDGKIPPKEALWQIYSEVILPPVAQPIVDQNGLSFVRPDLHDGCFIDDFYVPQILKYKKSEVIKAGVFDVAMTCEKWGPGPERVRYPYLVCSRKFRDWCLSQNLKLDWVPLEME